MAGEQMMRENGAPSGDEVSQGKTVVISDTNHQGLIIGQESAISLLDKSLVNNRLAHAYLFLGPEGCGRFTAALELARTLNCVEDRRLNQPCNCTSCRRLTRLEHPNFTVLFPLPSTEKDKGQPAAKAFEDMRRAKAGNPYARLEYPGTGQILIEQVRELRNLMTLTADEHGVRVAVILPASSMNQSAANALLKLLEEPPERCVLVLIAENRRTLLPTIVSRCHLIRFLPLGAEAISLALQTRTGVTPESAETVSLLSNGSFTQALDLITTDVGEKIEQSLMFLRAAATARADRIKKIADDWCRSKSRRELIELLRYASVWLGDALSAQVPPGKELDRNISLSGQQEVVQKLASRYAIDQIITARSQIEEARLEIESNAIAPLVITALAISLGRTLQAAS